MERCRCPFSAYILPEDKYSSANSGNQHEVISWLEGRWFFFGFFGMGDVNSRSRNGDTLLSAACAGGHHLLVEELLKYEDIHLNTRNSEGLTPLMISADKGHVSCVHLLLSAQLKCKLDISAKNNEGNVACTIAAKNNNWDVVLKILNSSQYNVLDQCEEVLVYAAKYKQWETFQSIWRITGRRSQKHWLKIAEVPLNEKDWDGLCVVLKCCQSTWVEKEMLIRLASSVEHHEGLSFIIANNHIKDEAYDSALRNMVVENNCWDGVEFLLAKHKYDNNSLLYNLSEAARKKLWPGVEIFLQKVHKESKLDVELTEKILQYSDDQIKQLLHSEMIDYGVLNGILIVSACSGAEEDVISTLLEHFRGYDYEILEALLFIGALKSLLKTLPPLLQYHGHVFTYDTLCSAKNLAKRLNHKDSVRILDSFINDHTKLSSTSYSVQGEGHSIGKGTNLALSSTGGQRKFGPLQLMIRRTPRQASSDAIDGGDVYKVNSVPRGLVLILNYQKFQDRADLQREGSQFDVINLMNLFSQMGYETQVHWDLTEDQTLHTVASFRIQPRLSDVDCAIIFIMSHGVARQTFHTSDMQCVTVDRIQSMFLDSECPYLKGKPKLFFYNFCRGIDEPQLTVQSDAVKEIPRDMICIYSAPEGFKSYRYAEAGTPFIISLCQVLSSDSCDQVLDDLLRTFKKTYSSCGHGNTPDIQDLNFAKKFYFNPHQ